MRPCVVMNEYSVHKRQMETIPFASEMESMMCGDTMR
jgi:hypothetical protein